LEITEADLAVCKDADSFLQSAMWGEFKSRFGWSAKAFLLNWTNNDFKETSPLLVLCRRLAPGFSFAYIPWGPNLPDSFSAKEKANLTAEIAVKIKSFIAKTFTFIRFEPPWFYTENADQETNNENDSALFLSAGFKRAAATVQPPDTVLINLNAPPQEILASMKPKWRYNISLAQKKGVQVKESGVQEIETFYSLLKETSARDGIAVHGINYYKTLFELCGQYNKDGVDLRLYTASYEGETLAAIIVLFRGKEATYLYGASSNNNRNLMAPYALQWKAMQDAKEAGCLFYDLFGIPPNADPTHPMAGLYRFKTGFGGQIIHRPGSWDYPYKPLVYALFNMAESLRKKLRDIKKKR
jgi:lipid II:glycine glycyltransferase (peptidoglycan interpeptide bridge formation enzyme)